MNFCQYVVSTTYFWHCDVWQLGFLQLGYWHQNVPSTEKNTSCCHQGEQIGRKLPKFFCHFFPRLRLCINFDKNGLGYILGDFITSSSGHPACHYASISADVCMRVVSGPLDTATMSAVRSLLYKLAKKTYRQLSTTGLPDGIFAYQKYQFWYFLKALYWFIYCRWVYFMAFLWSFGIYFPVLVCCTKNFIIV
jgi:hypothetical protein